MHSSCKLYKVNIIQKIFLDETIIMENNYINLNVCLMFQFLKRKFILLKSFLDAS